MEDPLVAQIREAIRKQSLRSSKELHDDMVRRGVIDEDGDVLIRMPELPEFLQPPKKRKKLDKPKKQPEPQAEA